MKSITRSYEQCHDGAHLADIIAYATNNPHTVIWIVVHTLDQLRHYRSLANSYVHNGEDSVRTHYPWWIQGPSLVGDVVFPNNSRIRVSLQEPYSNQRCLIWRAATQGENNDRAA